MAEYERVGEMRAGVEHRARGADWAVIIELNDRNDAIGRRMHEIFHEEVHAAFVLEWKRIGIESTFVVGQVVPAAGRMGAQIDHVRAVDEAPAGAPMRRI